MTDGKRVLEVRASLLTYLLKMLQLNIHEEVSDEALDDEARQREGKAKQVMVANRDELMGGCFKFIMPKAAFVEPHSLFNMLTIAHYLIF